MKGERRHELEKNELADWLAKWIERIKPYQNAILGTVLLVAVASVGYSWWAGQSSGNRAAAWDAFHRAIWDLSRAQTSPSPTDFEAIVDDFPDTDVALWARAMAGDLHLAFGCDALFRNKAVANQELREAVDHYLKVLESGTHNSILRQRATFGLARARESQGDLEKAMQHYEDVAKSWKDGAYAAVAASRLEDLKRSDTRLLYDQFAKFDPKPAISPDFGFPKGPPSFDINSLSDDGPLFEPKLPDLLERGAEDDLPKEPPVLDEPGDTQPGATDTAPTDTEPTDTVPTDTEPTDTAPTDTEPTDTEPTDTEPTDTEPTDTEPTDTEPTDTAPTDTPPTDTAPTDTAPTDTGPTDPKETDPTEPVQPPVDESE